MTVYMSAVMFIMFFFLENMWDIPFNETDDWTIEGEPSNKCKVFTMLFNIFIHLNLFNQINCRKVKPDQFNVFEHLFQNIYFIGVFCGVAGIQYIFVQWGGKLTRCATLAGDQYAFCVLVGMSSLLVSFILKLLPEKLNEKIPKLIDEKKSNQNDKLIQFYKKQAEAKVSIKKPAAKHAPVKP